MATFEHTKLGLALVIKDDLRQGDLERWSAATREYEPKSATISVRERYGSLLRGALKSAVATAARPGTAELKPGDVAELPPQWVNWYGTRLTTVYLEYDSIPPGMMVRAALAGETDGEGSGGKKVAPPAELKLFWRCQAFPGALPHAGGVQDQPAGLVPRMLAANNAYTLWRDYWRLPGVEFDERYPDGWDVVEYLLKLQASGMFEDR